MKALRVLLSIAILGAILSFSACRTFADTTMSFTSVAYDRSPMRHLGGSRSWQLSVSGDRCRLDTQANVYILAGPGRRAVLTDLSTGQLVQLDLSASTVVRHDLRAYAESLALEEEIRSKRWPPSPQPETHLTINRTAERRRFAGVACERWIVRQVRPPFHDGGRPRAPAWSLTLQELWVTEDTGSTREFARFFDRAGKGLPAPAATRDRILDEMGAFLVDPGTPRYGCGAPSPELRKALGGRFVVRAIAVIALQPSEEDLDRLVTRDRVQRLGDYAWDGAGERGVGNAIDSLFGDSAMETLPDRSQMWPGPHTGVTMVSTWTMDDVRQTPISPVVFEVPADFTPPKGCNCCFTPLEVPVDKK